MKDNGLDDDLADLKARMKEGLTEVELGLLRTQFENGISKLKEPKQKRKSNRKSQHPPTPLSSESGVHARKVL